MKRIISILLIGVMVLSLVACGNTPTNDASSVSDVSEAADSREEQLSLAQDDSQDDSVPVTEDESIVDENVFDEVEHTDESEQNSTVVETIEPDPVELNEVQINSIAMLNYLATLSQEINASKQSRMFLEEAYASVINDINPEMVDETTESHLASLLDIIEKYRMITVKRDRLQYIYEQNQANAIMQAVPNPIGLLSAVSSLDMKRIAASVVYMAVDSVASYNSYNNEIDMQYLQDGWELDDEESENVHESRKRAFMFMIDIVREYNLPGELALNETSVNEFVSWRNKTNTYQKIQFFESEESTYEAFDEYWLTLAECYYDNEQYDKCLEAFERYEAVHANIFRKDHSLATSIPQIIAAAREVYSDDEYIPFAERLVKMLEANTEKSEWALRYFAAQVYIDLYGKSGNESYLDAAYRIAKDNVNYLVDEQRAQNAAYLAEVAELPIPEDATKDEKKQIKEYNTSMKDARKTELPPVYEPLLLNCQLLFALAEEKGIDSAEQNRIEGILRHGGSVVFLNDVLENRYSFNSESIDVDAQFDKDTLTLPASCLCEASIVQVAVSCNGTTTLYADWTVNKVKREENSVDSFVVTLKNEDIDDQSWAEGATVTVSIFSSESDTEPLKITFRLTKYVNNWWQIGNAAEFEQVK